MRNPYSYVTVLKRAAAKKWRHKEAVRLNILDLTFNERVEWILDEMNRLCQEEWFEIAHMAGVGGPGFSPMRQLQLRIRHSPQVVGPTILGAFKNSEGKWFTRAIRWPRFEKMAHEWKPVGALYAFDLYPHLTIAPLMDLWDKHDDLYGVDHPRTKALVRQIIRLCTVDYGYEPDKPLGKKPLPPRTWRVRAGLLPKPRPKPRV